VCERTPFEAQPVASIDGVEMLVRSRRSVQYQRRLDDVEGLVEERLAAAAGRSASVSQVSAAHLVPPHAG